MEMTATTVLADKTPAQAGNGRELIPLEQREDVTVDELERLSLPYPAELYEGRVVYKMPNLEHGFIQTNLIKKLSYYLDEHPVGIVVPDTNFRLWSDRPDASRIPDVCFISNDRVPEDWRGFPAMSPDLAIEIVSPNDGVEDVLEKADEYLQQGSRLVWLVIPKTREVLVCTPQRKFSVRDVLTAPELLPGFELKVADIFAGLKQ